MFYLRPSWEREQLHIWWQWRVAPLRASRMQSNATAKHFLWIALATTLLFEKAWEISYQLVRACDRSWKGNRVHQVPCRVNILGIDSLSFLTLITKFQSNSAFCILRTEWLWSLVIRVRKPDSEGYWLRLGSWVNQVLLTIGSFDWKIDLKLDSLGFLTLITKLQSHSAFCKIPLSLGKPVLENKRDGLSWTCLLSDRVMLFSNVHCKQSHIFLLSHTSRARVRGERRSLEERGRKPERNGSSLWTGFLFGERVKKREEREGKGWGPVDKHLGPSFQAPIGENTDCWHVVVGCHVARDLI